ncbi:MAG: hypothetical protein ACJA1I_000276 [Zhongshania marina]|jgi:hypothetical protein
MNSHTDTACTISDIAQHGAKFSLISIVFTGLYYCIATLF